MNRNNFYAILSFLISNCFCYCQNDTKFFEAIIIDKETKSAIPYANIVNLNQKQIGTTSNESGYFFFTSKQLELGDELNFSAVGYKSIKLLYDRIYKDTLRIELEPYIYELNEVVVFSQKLLPRQIGSFNYKLAEGTSKEKLGVTFYSAGLSLGVYVSPKRKNRNSKLLKINYFVADKGPLGSSFSIRILSPKEKIRDNRMNVIKDFSDLLRLPIIINAEKRGWNSIDVSFLNILINKPFVILFTPLYEGEKYKWKQGNYTYYGSTLGYYNAIKMPEMKACIYSKDIFTVVNDGETMQIPAIILDCRKQK